MIESQKHLFDIPDDICYLNCAYMSPLSRVGRQDAERGIRESMKPWGIKTHHFFEDSNEIRRLFAAIIGANANDIAIIPSVSYGIGTAAKNMKLEKGTSILVLEEQFPSHIYPWRELAFSRGLAIKTVAKPDDFDWTTAVLEAMESAVSLVAIPICHWTDGSWVDIEKIGLVCRRRGIPLVLDGTQSVGALPFDVKKVDPDYLVCAGYKWLFGPYGLSYMYVAPRNQHHQPLEFNWITRKDSHQFAELVNYRDEYAEGAQRFDMGERSNGILLPVGIAALKMILNWGVEQIADSLAQYTFKISELGRELGFTSVEPRFRGPHMIGLRHPKGFSSQLPQQLSEQGVFVSVRGNAIRISPHVYNDNADIEHLAAALKK